MLTREKVALRKIDAALEVLGQPAGGYLVRTRLKRALVDCARIVSRRTGTPLPEWPVPLMVTFEDSDDLAARIAVRCNELLEAANRLTRPSEALDDKWTAEAMKVGKDLVELRDLIERLQDC